MSATFSQWLDSQYRHSAEAMTACISAVDMVKQRPGFAQTVRALPGSVIASPVLGAYDPDPDYFFHWYRDSAVVIDALRLLVADGSAEPEAVSCFGEFVRFSRSLAALDGRKLAMPNSQRAGVAADFVRYLRDDAEMAAVHGELVAAETRVNPDSTLDISKWARPQHDGPPLRALAVLRWLESMPLDTAIRAEAGELVRADLAFTLRRWHEPSFDIWEEERGLHYYTLRVSAAALADGAAWLEAAGEHEEAVACRGQAEAVLHSLDRYWQSEAGYYRSRLLSGSEHSTKDLDISVILAAIHAGGHGAHSVHDPRMQTTLARLEALFDADYPINHQRSAGTGPAMGRYAGDVYYSGGAYYFSTLGAAEFCFRAAAGAPDPQTWIARGDGFLATVRAYTPADGALSEQFDQRGGAQTSAKQLAWSHAAFISCAAARRRVVGRERR